MLAYLYDQALSWADNDEALLTAASLVRSCNEVKSVLIFVSQPCEIASTLSSHVTITALEAYCPAASNAFTLASVGSALEHESQVA